MTTATLNPTSQAQVTVPAKALVICRRPRRVKASIRRLTERAITAQYQGGAAFSANDEF